MNVVVEFYGQARVAAGCERSTVEVAAGCPARDAVLRAAEALPELRGFLLDAAGQPRRSVLLAVGHRQVSWDGGDELREGDTVTVFPPIAGG
jgi:molybdopterin converting factor small subunit